MPSGIYTRPKRRPKKAVASEMLQLGLTTRVNQILADLRTLAEQYPIVLTLFPALAPALETPLKPDLTAAERAKVVRIIKAKWNGRGETAPPEQEINPRTGKPYTMSAATRAKMAKRQRARMKDPKLRRRAVAGMLKAAAKRWPNGSKHSTKTRALLSKQAKARWANMRAAGIRGSRLAANITAAEPVTTE